MLGAEFGLSRFTNTYGLGAWRQFTQLRSRPYPSPSNNFWHRFQSHHLQSDDLALPCWSYEEGR